MVSFGSVWVGLKNEIVSGGIVARSVAIGFRPVVCVWPNGPLDSPVFGDRILQLRDPGRAAGVGPVPLCNHSSIF